MDRRPKGFTLVELVASLAIAGIVLGVGAPVFNRAIQSHRASSVLSTLTASLASGRVAAISRSRSVVLCPSGDGASCTGGTDWSAGWILFADADGNRSRSKDEALLSHEPAIPTALRLRSTAGRRAVRFQPSGMSEGANLTLTLCAGSERLAQVMVNNAGRTRTERMPGTCRDS